MDSVLCRLCGQYDDTVQDLLAGCTVLVGTEYEETQQRIDGGSRTVREATWDYRGANTVAPPAMGNRGGNGE